MKVFIVLAIISFVSYVASQTHFSDEKSRLYLAISRGKVELVESLLKRGVSSESKSYGTPALHFAIIFENQDMVKALLSSGAEVNSLSSAGRGALHWAAARGAEEIVRELLRRGAVDRQDKYFETAVHWAASMCHSKVVDEILKSQMNMLNVVDRDGWTAAHWASYRGCDNVLLALCRLGANPTIESKPDEIFRSISGIALSNGHSQLSDKLHQWRHIYEQNGPSINRPECLRLFR